MKRFLLALLLSSNIVSSKNVKRFNTKPNKELPSVLKIDKNKRNHIPDEWEPLLNPKTDEFWTEGNHLPDKGFLLLAKNPESVEYAKYWLLRMEKKAEVTQKILKTVEKAQRELVSKGLMEDRYWQFQDLKNGNISSSFLKKNLKKLNFYFLFSSTCPHCKSLAKNLIKIPNIRPLQVDKQELLNFEGLSKTTRASQETLNSYLSDGIVPVIVIHNPKTNVVTKITGNRPIDEYFLAANSLLKGKK